VAPSPRQGLLRLVLRDQWRQEAALAAPLQRRFVALEVPPPVLAVVPPTGLAAVAEEWEYEADSASPPQVPRFPHRRRLLLRPPLSLHLPVMEFDALTKYSKLVTNFCSASFSKLAARAEDFSAYLVWDFVYTHSSATTLYDVEAATVAATLLPQRLYARVLSESPRQRLQQVVESEEVARRVQSGRQQRLPLRQPEIGTRRLRQT
jgi:hypothetical protein